MSGADNNNTMAVARMMCCASCGKSELDEVKLKECANCKSVRYCSDNCKEDHRPEHESKCKERASKLRDEILFRQSESTHLGDCPICCLPLPTNSQKSSVYSCCSKYVCDGCSHADTVRQDRENMVPSCPFCRHPMPRSEEECDKIMMKRVAANDPFALGQIAVRYNLRGEYDKAFEYCSKAAALGDADAHYNLSRMYLQGQGVEKDEKKEIYHLEEAAIAGHPCARNNLGCYDWNNGRFDRAVKHFSIAANLGFDLSINALKEYYKDGDVSKEDFAAALRGHYAAVKAMKSPQREAAEKLTLGREMESTSKCFHNSQNYSVY